MSAFMRRCAPLPLVCILAGCNGADTAYRSGPWGHSPSRDPATPLYSGPWQPPPGYATVEEIDAAPPPARRIAPEPMEPIGAWTSRDVAPPPESDEVLESPPGPAGDAGLEEYGKPSAIVSKSAPEEPSPRARAPSARHFTSLTGAWTIREGGAGSCRLQLSSVSTLDLYKASSARCSNQLLQDINAWSVREGDLVLYSRGRVVARLREDGANFIGRLGGGGTSIRITR